MATFMSDNVLDSGVTYIDTNTEILHICNALPLTYANIATYTVGNKATPTVGVPEDGATGRKVVVSAITDGSVTADDTATHWCLAKDSATAELICAATLSAPQVVSNGNTFTLDAIDITIPDPV